MQNNIRHLQDVRKIYIKERQKIENNKMKKQNFQNQKMQFSIFKSLNYKYQNMSFSENMSGENEVFQYDNGDNIYSKYDFTNSFSFDGSQTYTLSNNDDLLSTGIECLKSKSNLLNGLNEPNSTTHISQSIAAPNTIHKQKQIIGIDEMEIIDLSDSNSSSSYESNNNDQRRFMNVDHLELININASISDSSTLTTALFDLEDFALETASANKMVKCLILRDKACYPIYRLYLDCNKGDPLFLLTARRRKKSKSSNYLITSSPTDSKRNGKDFIGKLRGNFTGNNYVVFDYGKKNGTTDIFDENNKQSRRELSGISYDTSSIGFKSPRKMTVIIPAIDRNNRRMEFYKTKNSDSLLENWKKQKMINLLKLHNKDTRSYTLDFHDRVTKASVKNFQLIQDHDVDHIVMQFGKLSQDVFAMDFSYPLCALQAFGISLSSFDCQIVAD